MLTRPTTRFIDAIAGHTDRLPAAPKLGSTRVCRGIEVERGRSRVAWREDVWAAGRPRLRSKRVLGPWAVTHLGRSARVKAKAGCRWCHAALPGRSPQAACRTAGLKRALSHGLYYLQMEPTRPIVPAMMWPRRAAHLVRWTDKSETKRQRVRGGQYARTAVVTR